MISAYYDIAKMIHPNTRRDMLAGNYIFKAIASVDDLDMKRLFIIYSNYIEPNNPQYQLKNGIIGDVCLACIQKVLDKFILLEPYLVSLERESKLLEL